MYKKQETAQWKEERGGKTGRKERRKIARLDLRLRKKQKERMNEREKRQNRESEGKKERGKEEKRKRPPAPLRQPLFKAESKIYQIDNNQRKVASE